MVHEELPTLAQELARVIDHTLLKADATEEELRKHCSEAVEHGFRTVCVNSCNVRFCSEQLQRSDVVPIAVVGFPLGAALAEAKAFEARLAVRAGASEIDTVLNIGALKSKNYAAVKADIDAVVRAVRVPVKVILETSRLSRDEKITACVLAKMAGAAFVKTCTGFGGGGATEEDVALMRETVGPTMGVKASGGVRTAEDVRRMLAAGATRIGASASVSIVQGAGASIPHEDPY